jgi:hypothetical protein
MPNDGPIARTMTLRIIPGDDKAANKNVPRRSDVEPGGDILQPDAESVKIPEVFPSWGR